MFIVSCSSEDGTWGWGCLDFCHHLGTVRSGLGAGISLVGASGPILTIIDDVGQVCYVLVVAACMLMKHCKSVESILRGFHPSCILQKVFNLVDVGCGFSEFLSEETTLIADHFYIVYFVFTWCLCLWHMTGLVLLLHKESSFLLVTSHTHVLWRHLLGDIIHAPS